MNKLDYIEELYANIPDNQEFYVCRDGSIYYDDYLYCSPLWDLYNDDLYINEEDKIFLQKADENGDLLIDDTIEYNLTYDLNTDIINFKRLVKEYVDNKL